MPSAYQAQLAVDIILERRSARRSLVEWARLCGYEPAAHHLLLIEMLEAVVRGDIKRLAVFMPPGSAKSTYASVLFPPWYLAQGAGTAILTASHSADMAVAFGRKARNLVADREKILGYSLRQDSQASDEWATSNGGEFFCAGVGGRIAGRRADLALIDDPVGSREDAYSKLVRDKTWDWYKFDFRSRFKPGCSIVLIQTRWHEDDLAGRLLSSEKEEWTIINLPLIAKEGDVLGRKPGEMLWSDYFNEQILNDAKKDSMVFSALYQQDPTPEDGEFFKKDWIDGNAYERAELPPLKELTLYGVSDHAVSESQQADSTCLVPAGVDSENTIWILPEVFWEQANSLAVVEAMLTMMGRFSFRTWWMESEMIQKSIGPFLMQRMREEGVFCHIEPVRPARDKVTRAQSIRGRIQMGGVRLPRFAPWFPAAREQLLKFPAGSHDDFVDPLAWLGLGLDKLVRGSRAKAPPVYRFESPPITLGSLKRGERFALAMANSMDN